MATQYRRNGLQHSVTAQTCMLADEDPAALLDLLEEIREKFDPQDTDEDFLVERMAKARFKYNRIMPLEAAIFNLRLAVDKAPEPLIAAQGQSSQRAWAYMRDANGGNALSKLARHETSLLREYDRSRLELEKLQKIRAAKAAKELRGEPDAPVSPIPPKSSRTRKSASSVPKSRAGKPAAAAHSTQFDTFRSDRRSVESGFGDTAYSDSSKPASGVGNTS